MKHLFSPSSIFGLLALAGAFQAITASTWKDSLDLNHCPAMAFGFVVSSDIIGGLLEEFTGDAKSVVDAEDEEDRLVQTQGVKDKWDRVQEPVGNFGLAFVDGHVKVKGVVVDEDGQESDREAVESHYLLTVVDGLAQFVQLQVDLVEQAEDLVIVQVLPQRIDQGSGHGDGVYQQLNVVGEDGDRVLRVALPAKGAANGDPVKDHEDRDGHARAQFEFSWSLLDGMVFWRYSKDLVGVHDGLKESDEGTGLFKETHHFELGCEGHLLQGGSFKDRSFQFNGLAPSGVGSLGKEVCFQKQLVVNDQVT